MQCRIRLIAALKSQSGNARGTIRDRHERRRMPAIPDSGKAASVMTGDEASEFNLPSTQPSCNIVTSYSALKPRSSKDAASLFGFEVQLRGARRTHYNSGWT
jgi:hypothetical protein